ncbi:MAG: hypothetical protein EOP48_16820 [Sphingobacteriales bacterium]|nr:MAG: hypothetical protein EOP48_16820 [Sphingobacteriales bacterium]
MSDKIKNSEPQKGAISPFEYFIEVIGWLQIVASPLILGLIVGTCIYLSDPTIIRLALGLVMALIGLITGIVFATRVWRKQGTINFITRVKASPELDNLEKDEK